MKENLDDDLNAHNDVVRIERIAHHIQRIREDQHSMRAAIERMSEAVTRLALVEERQAVTSTAIERLVQSLERLDERLRKLEVSEPLQARSSEWIMNAVWAAAAGAVMFMAGKAGLF